MGARSEEHTRSGESRAPRPSSVQRFFDIFVDRWTHLVLRESFFGVRRFDEFQRNLGISRNVLTKRLNHLVTHGLLERRLYQHRPDRYEYVLTERGVDMYPVFVAMMRWGDRWLDDGKGPPVRLYHSVCHRQSNPLMVCDKCGEEIHGREMTYTLGPGAEGGSTRARRRFDGFPRPDGDHQASTG
ncbi:MAG: helix-turn-helix transcriptional regulator [Solirubrobacterales bacterium]|nr:helix-turn-helix transcriptional regulator [Solirubrobacterales bacterium]